MRAACSRLRPRHASRASAVTTSRFRRTGDYGRRRSNVAPHHSASGAPDAWRSVARPRSPGQRPVHCEGRRVGAGVGGVVPDLLLPGHPRAAETEHREVKTTSVTTQAAAPNKRAEQAADWPATLPATAGASSTADDRRRTTPGAPGKRVPPWRERTDETAIGDQGAA